MAELSEGLNGTGLTLWVPMRTRIKLGEQLSVRLLTLDRAQNENTVSPL